MGREDVAGYKNILVAVDFSEHSEYALEKALAIANDTDSVVSVVHVVDNLPLVDSAYDSSLAFSVDITDELVAASKNKLAELANKYQMAAAQLSVEVGAVRNEIVDRAEKIGAELIVIGSHGWRGLDLLLGSIADGVLHHAHCDVLVVKLKN